MADEVEGAVKPRRTAETMEFTKSRLDGLLRGGRPHRQSMVWDTKCTGLSVLISRGPKQDRQATVTFRVVYYLKDQPGKPRYWKLGRYPDDYQNFNIDDVRNEASNIRADARQGIDPRKPRLTGDVKGVVERFIEDHVKSNRTCDEITRQLNRYVVPEWAERQIESITKTDVSDLLNRIARGDIKYVDKYGKSRKAGTPAVARAVRTQLSTLFNWYVDNHGSDAFRSPIVKTAKTQKWKPKDRDRVLRDDEIRALWVACGEMGAYGAAVKCALLTVQRFRKVGQMRRRDLKDSLLIEGYMDADNNWIDDQVVSNVWDPTRPDDPRNKKVSLVFLTPLARSIIASVPIIDVDQSEAEDFVFTTTGRGPLKGWSKYKTRLDGKMLALLRQWRGGDPEQVTLKPWQQRDLRRTARTLMARAGVRPDIAEHCTAHVLPGTGKIYDRWGYLAEKRDAFGKLSDLIERIVNPPEGNVVPLAGAASKRKATRRA